MKKTNVPFRRRESLRIVRVFAAAAVPALLLASASVVIRHGPVLAAASRAPGTLPSGRGASSESPSYDSLGDGFPDSARLDRLQDRENFTRWFTFLAETQFYATSPQARVEVQDCAALVRFAFRNSLVVHSPAWREYAGLPYDPGFGDITKYHYPYGPLGQGLFRIQPAPTVPGDLAPDAFGEFADSATLLRYNTYRISRDIRSAQPGDLLFFHQAVQREPFHTMLFVGRSYYQPQGADWIVYHTGDLDGHRGEIREVKTGVLLQHPDLHWRPMMSNPNFLGVYRLEILR